MAKFIDKNALVTELKKRIRDYWSDSENTMGIYPYALEEVIKYADNLEMKEVDLIIHTIIAECCDWLAMSTNLSHDEIEGCRNLMLTVKDEQLKAQKGEV